MSGSSRTLTSRTPRAIEMVEKKLCRNQHTVIPKSTVRELLYGKNKYELLLKFNHNNQSAYYELYQDDVLLETIYDDYIRVRKVIKIRKIDHIIYLMWINDEIDIAIMLYNKNNRGLYVKDF